MADLYGELLARTLNRGAPPGHSAAYITPQEALRLRASGGGVAPGGGQYMANGIPSFQYGHSDLGGFDVTGVGAVSAAQEAAAGHSGSFQDAYGIGLQAAAEHAQRQAGRENPFHAVPQTLRAAPAVPIAETREEIEARNFAEALQGVLTQRQMDELEAVDRQTVQASIPQQTTAPGRATAPPPETLHEIAARNIERAINNPNLYDKNTSTWTEAGVAELGEDISSSPFAAGYYSPAATLARNNRDATAGQVAAVNQHSSRTGGYSVNDPYDNVSVPAGMNMGMIPALAGTIAGFAHPAIGLSLMAGYPTLGRMALNAARADTGMIGSALRGFQTNVTDPINRAFDAVTQPITQPIEQLGGFLGGRVRSGASAVGGFLDENVVDPLGQFATGLGEDITGAFPGFSIGDVLSQGETPVGTFQGPQTGGNQEVYVPPQPAPVTEPFVSEEQVAENYYVPPKWAQDRIDLNVEEGRRQQALANALLSQSAPIDTGIGFA
jgi:hypothetical protein